MTTWSELAARDPDDAAVLEGRLAVAFNLAGQGAYSNALNGYGQALAALGNADRNILASIEAIRSGATFDHLLAINPPETLRARVHAPMIEGAVSGFHWAMVLGDPSFQAGFDSYRDLVFLSRTLATWRERLLDMEEMLAQRRSVFSEKLGTLQVSVEQERLAASAEQVRVLRQRIHEAETTANGALLADDRERRAGLRIDRVRANLARLAPPDQDKYKDRLRRVSGALLWQQQQAFAPRLRAVKTELALGEQGLELAGQKLDKLRATALREPGRLDRLAQRIEESGRRLEAQVPLLENLQSSLRTRLQDQAIRILEAHRAAIGAYGDQARFAIAQIYDRSSRKGGSADANASIRPPSRPAQEADHAR